MDEKRLIDANALCESFEKAAYKCEYIDDMVFHLDYILDEITGADEVDAVEVVHGRWVTDGLGDGERVCSVCKRYALYTHRDKYDQYLTTYCPNCGAKMDLEENE